MTILAFFVGVALTAWVLTLAGVAYAIWRYCFQPWAVLRRDVSALNEKLDALAAHTEQMLTSKRFAAMTDEELVSIERRMRQESVGRVRVGR